MSTNTAAALHIAPHFTPATGPTDPTLAPEVVAALRTARSLGKQKDAIDEAADAAKRIKAAEIGVKGSISGLEKRERDARMEAGKLLGSTTLATVDGETLAVEIGERGGGNPDYASAWSVIREQMTPDWQRFMDETIAACVTAASMTVKITPVPTGATLAPVAAPLPTPPAVPAVSGAPTAPSAKPRAAARKPQLH